MIKKPTTLHACTAVLLIGIFAILTGCGRTGKTVHPSTEPDGQFTCRETATVGDTAPQRIINDYSGMTQQDTVAWVWTKPGFDPRTCPGAARVLPLQNYSAVDYPWAEKKLAESLRQIFQTRGDAPGTTSLEVATAIVEMIPETGLLNRFFPSLSDLPYLEIEVVVRETSSGERLCRICHYTRDREFGRALIMLTDDLQRFFGSSQTGPMPGTP